MYYVSLLESMEWCCDCREYSLRADDPYGVLGRVWHITPFAMNFLLRIFLCAFATRRENAITWMIAEMLLGYFWVVVE